MRHSVFWKACNQIKDWLFGHRRVVANSYLAFSEISMKKRAPNKERVSRIDD